MMPPRSRLGVATTSYLSYLRPKDTLQFLEHCNEIGAAGIQAPLTSLEPDYLTQVERRSKDLGMYVEIMAALPKVDMSRFVATIEAAKRVGARCVRSACLSGRRYEIFNSLEDWNKFVADSRTAIARAVPVMEKHKLPLALENHKDWTLEEFVPLLKTYSTQYLGVCLDMGNNIALLDDPMEVVEKLAPFAVATHIKDMAVESSTDGFLLSEVPLGKGMLDIKQIVAIVAKARPDTPLTLEMITRDPLRVPALSDKYWITFPERNGIYLVRTLRMVQEKSTKLPVFSNLSRPAQLKAEEDNVRHCLASIS
jgi:3-oxoisoapionate decarboxylase